MPRAKQSANRNPVPYPVPGTGPAQGLAQLDTVGTMSPADLAKLEPTAFEEKCEEKAKKRSFIFTMNNPTMTPEELITWAQGEGSCTGLLFQKEVGKEGTTHYQGYLRFKNARLFGSLCTQLSAWVRPCNNDLACRKYCSKKESRVAGPWGFGVPEAKEEIAVLSDDQLYDWQKDLVAILKGKPDDRSILWYWDEKGNVGKTTFTKYLAVKMNAYVFDGKAADVKGALADMQENGKPIPDILVWDIPRTMEQFVSYQALEQVKNGIFFSGKFHGSMVTYNPRHVLVFANFYPDTTKMSEDRWSQIVKLD